MECDEDVCGLSAAVYPTTLSSGVGAGGSSPGPAGAGTADGSRGWTYDGASGGCVGGGGDCASLAAATAAAAAVPAPLAVPMPPLPPPRTLKRILSLDSTGSVGEEDLGTAGGAGCATPSPPPLLPFDGLALHQLQTLLQQEASGRYAVVPDYMTSVYGGAMVPRWRQQLVEWMAEVVREFHLSDATYFAAVQLLDRLLSARRIRAEELQAFALVCCIVCAKIHDSKFIRMSHVERYFRDIAQVADVVAMEVAVSNALAWDLVGCTPFDFLSQLCGLVPAEATKGLFGFQDAATLGRVLLKDSVCLARLAASEYDLLQYSPSEVGTACFMLAARHVCGAHWAVAYMQALHVLTPPSPALVATLGAMYPGGALDPRGSPAAVTQV